MFLCGSNFVGGASACTLTPTGLTNINYIALQNGIYDDLYITKAVSFEPTAACPGTWDFDTILWATFNQTANAGNVDWNVSIQESLSFMSCLDGRSLPYHISPSVV